MAKERSLARAAGLGRIAGRLLQPVWRSVRWHWAGVPRRQPGGVTRTCPPGVAKYAGRRRRTSRMASARGPPLGERRAQHRLAMPMPTGDIGGTRLTCDLTKASPHAAMKLHETEDQARQRPAAQPRYTAQQPHRTNSNTTPSTARTAAWSGIADKRQRPRGARQVAHEIALPRPHARTTGHPTTIRRCAKWGAVRRAPSSSKAISPMCPRSPSARARFARRRSC